MSFLSVEPQSRVVLESHSESLLAQFDAHLQIIADRYLAFFQERRRIEATYIDSLRRLYRKAKVVDASFDARSEPTNTRAAWDGVRNSLDGEANAHQAFMDILDKDAIKPLTTLKESQTETRKQNEEGLEKSAAKYADFAENTISNLQQTYLKKYHPRLGGKVSAPSRPWSRRQQEDQQDNDRPAQTTDIATDDVSDDNLRKAISYLNDYRLIRAQILGDGYDCLEDLVFTPTVNDVLVKYMNGMITTCGKHYGLALNTTKATVEKVLAGTNTPDMRASFRRGLSFAIPPLILYRKYNHPGPYSELIFGAPLVDLGINGENVPKVMKMCIEEVEKRGLNTMKIYSMGKTSDAGVRQLRRRFETDRSFSFSSTDDIHCIAMLLKLYLRELPEPLFMLSLQDYRLYGQDRARYIEDDFFLLRSKICANDPACRASLRTLLQHLLRVASHSDKNKMTVDALASSFGFAISRGHKFLEHNVKKLVLKDLIQNVHTLFDGRPLSPPIPSPDVLETMSTLTDSSLFLSPEFPRSAEVKSTSQHHPGIIGGIPVSAQSSFSSLLSDTASESRLTPSPTPLLSPLLGLPSQVPSSPTLRGGGEITTGEKFKPKARDTKAVATSPNNIQAPPEVSSQVAPMSVAEWQLQVLSPLSPQPEVLTRTIPQSPPESVRSNTSDFPLSSATSLQTRIG